MMKLSILSAPSSTSQENWVLELKKILTEFPKVKVNLISELKDLDPKVKIVFVDENIADLGVVLQNIDRKNGKAVFLVSDHAKKISKFYKNGMVDDVLIYPLRFSEVVSKVHQVQKWDEVRKLNEKYSEIVERLKEDLKLAERLQQARFPVRFDDIRGFKVRNKYLAGLRSGGDYFDIESSKQNGGQVSFVLTDSSSYGLSTAVLSLLMGVAARLSAAGNFSTYEVVSSIFRELSLTLGEKDHLSMFYGLVSRKDLVLRYLASGSCGGFIAHSGEGFKKLQSVTRPLSRKTQIRPDFEQSVSLQPDDRLILVSDGFLDSFQKPEDALALLNRFRDEPAEALLSELAYRVKSQVEDEEFPEQDCTAVVLDVDSQVIRLAS